MALDAAAGIRQPLRYRHEADTDTVTLDLTGLDLPAAAGAPDPGRIGRTCTTTGRTHDGRGYTTGRWYTVRGRKVLEYWLVEGLGHAWSGGRDGGSFSDPTGPRAATLMWQFFSSHKLERRLGPASRAAGA